MSQEPNLSEPDGSVHAVLAEVLMLVFEYAVTDELAWGRDLLTWEDIADEFVLALGGRVVCIATEHYDDIITSHRDFRRAVHKIDEVLDIAGGRQAMKTLQDVKKGKSR